MPKFCYICLVNTLITILGPTASGKTPFAAALAADIGGEIVSADSRQVYRGMDIGTGKDLADYEVGGRHVPFHLIDIAAPGTRYNLYRYQHDACAAIADIERRGHCAILCGGTGLYIEAVLKGYRLSTVEQNPELRASLEGKSMDELTEMLRALKAQTGSAMHNTTDVDSPQRAVRAIEIESYNLTHADERRDMPARQSVIIGLDIPREERRRKISQRLRHRLEQEDMVGEIKRLIDSGVKADDLIYYGLEYRFVTEYVIGRISYEEMYRQLEIAIHQFAKRQMTWFRGMERRGLTIHWLDALLPMDEKVRRAKEIVEEFKNEQ